MLVATGFSQLISDRITLTGKTDRASAICCSYGPRL